MSAKPSLIKRIFIYLWAVINGIRKTVLNLIFFGILFAILIAMGGDEEIKIENNSALLLNIGGSIVDQKRHVDPVEAVLKQSNNASTDHEVLLSDIVYVIRNASSDQRIANIVLDLSRLHRVGISKLETIGSALEEFKASGKKIYAVGNYYNQKQYYLASFADEIYLNPQGMVAIDGLSRYRQYFKSALDKLKINAHVFRVGTFKSAVEPFLRDDMSDAAKQANSDLLSDIWQSYTHKVAQNRNIETNKLALNADAYLAALEKADGDAATVSLNMNWVDKLATAEEFRLAMIERVGQTKHNQYKHIDFYDYHTLVKPLPQIVPQDSVGIIVAKGTILNGKQPAGDIGGESTSALLRKARFDDKIKAVVLRVDSPGGSAFASEQIRQEVLALKAAGKPVVASMSSMAASGGYWISASADYIYAKPTTLTGSIGIFGMITTFENSLASLGIHTDGVATSDWAGIRPSRALTPQVKAVIQRHIERGYHEFISMVASERNMSVEQVDKIAQGRVWSGKKALEIGLVDALGDLDKAVAKAAELAKMDKFDSKIIEKELTPEEIFIQQMLASAVSYLPESVKQPSVLERVLSHWTQTIEEFAAFDDPNGVYLYCDQCNF